MPVIFTKGDLLQTPNLHAFAHGCDFTGAMASGLSLAFKKRWPAMAEDFKQRVTAKRPQIGDLLVWTDGTDTVYSLILQETPEKKAKLTAFDRATQAMIKAAVAAKIEQIGMGRVGAGPAGLDWLRVKRVLTERTEGAPVTVNVYEQFIRTKAESDANTDAKAESDVKADAGAKAESDVKADAGAKAESDGKAEAGAKADAT